MGVRKKKKKQRKGVLTLGCNPLRGSTLSCTLKVKIKAFLSAQLHRGSRTQGTSAIANY